MKGILPIIGKIPICITLPGIIEKLSGIKSEAAKQQMGFQVLTGSWRIWSQMMAGLPTYLNNQHSDTWINSNN